MVIMDNPSVSFSKLNMATGCCCYILYIFKQKRGVREEELNQFGPVEQIFHDNRHGFGKYVSAKEIYIFFLEGERLRRKRR
jgi:hypothetical protein